MAFTVRWSQLKHQIEQRMAPSLAGRVKVYATGYIDADDGDGRGWITIDGREVASFCSFTARRRQRDLQTLLHSDLGTANIDNPTHEHSYFDTHYEAVNTLRRQGVMTREHFYAALRQMLLMPINDALTSDVALIRALAMTDSRVGKRRLRAIVLPDDEHPLVQTLYALRCEVEGMRPGSTGQS